MKEARLFSSSESDDQMVDESLFKSSQKTTTTSAEKQKIVAHTKPLKNVELTKELTKRLSGQKSNLFDDQPDPLFGNEDLIAKRSSDISETSKTTELPKKTTSLFDDDSKSDDSDDDIFKYAKKNKSETTKKEAINIFEDLPDIPTDSKTNLSEPNQTKLMTEDSKTNKTQPPKKSIFSFSDDEESDEDSLFSFKKPQTKSIISVESKKSSNQSEIKQPESQVDQKSEAKVSTSLFDDDQDDDQIFEDFFTKEPTSSFKSSACSKRNVSARNRIFRRKFPNL